MRMVKLLVHLPAPLKAKLASLRAQGTTASGFVRCLLERELSQGKQSAQKGR